MSGGTVGVESVRVPLTRRQVVEVAGTLGAAAAVWALVPSLTRSGPPTTSSLLTSFGEVTVFEATRIAAPLLVGPLRHGVWGDALAVSVGLRNVTGRAQWLPSGQFQVRLLDGMSVTAYDVVPRLFTVRPRAADRMSLTFLVPRDGEVAKLEFTEPGALTSLSLALPPVGRRSRAGVAAGLHSPHGG